MVFATLSTIAAMTLAVLNVYSTFKVLRDDSATKLRGELKFWSVYVLVIVVTDLFRADKPELQFVATLALVLCRHLDTENVVLHRVFDFFAQGVATLDTHFIQPNAQKLLVQPCALMVTSALRTLQQSRSLSTADRALAVRSVESSAAVVSAEILVRDKRHFHPNDASSSKSPVSASHTPSAGGGAGAGGAGAGSAATPVRPKKPELSFTTLRQYFDACNAAMSDAQITQILKTFVGRDDDLRQKLQAKYGQPVEQREPGPAAVLSTPRFVDGHVGTLKSHMNSSEEWDDVSASSVMSDGPALRRRHVAGAHRA
jgi:hypothetical protein